MKQPIGAVAVDSAMAILYRAASAEDREAAALLMRSVLLRANEGPERSVEDLLASISRREPSLTPEVIAEIEEALCRLS